RTQKRSGFDAVGHDAVLRAMQALYAVDDDAVGAVALDACAHLDEQLGEVDDLRLTCGILENGATIGQGRRHHEVLRARHGDHVGADGRTLETCGTCHDVTVFDVDLCAHRGQPLDVLVDGALADGAAAGQAHA